MDSIDLYSQNTVSSIVPWEQVCRMLDKVQNATKDKKKLMLHKFIEQYKNVLNKKSKNKNLKQPTETFFPVMRILLPDLDRDRGAYGLKENKLAELYIRILGLRKDSVDAQTLLNYRKPKSGLNEVGDFADIAYYILKNRCPEKGSLSLYEVDTHLTTIAESYASKNHQLVEKTILIMLRKMTASEQKWLIRVLLKDMHLGIGKVSIFNAWHPDAKDYYDVTNSIAKVCVTLCDSTVRLHEIEISLLQPFRPMLAERVILDKIETQMSHKTFFVEIKYDGERSQIHKKGNIYKYFSRNAFDFTDNFGGTPKNGRFTPYLHSLFWPHIQEVILDGEMVCWSQKHKTIITKGENVDVKNLKEGGDLQVCFCAFDLLYLNGNVLSNLPLNQRLDKLKNVLQPCDGRVIITSYSEVTSKDDVIKALNQAIDNREEGVVLKDPDSVYQPAARKGGWIKVKPDYFDSLIPELDLLIVGGYYGEGRRRGIISHFLLAIAESTEATKENPKIFHSFCRIGSGYTDAELESLIAKLSSNMTKKQPQNVIVCKEKPDVWIKPEKSCVVQVRGAEIVKTDLYKTGVTLRFPRVESIRSDKSWFDIMNTDELQKLLDINDGKIATKYYGNNDAKNTQSKRKLIQQRRHASLPDYFSPADISKVVKGADFFYGKEFCIMVREKEQKHQVEKLVAEHGGVFCQNPGEETFCIICDRVSVRIQQYINKNIYNVVKPSWIFDCVTAQKWIPWSPVNIFYLLDKDMKKMNEEFDEYGDSFYSDTNIEQLQFVISNMHKNSYSSDLLIDEMCEIDLRTTEPGDLRDLFRRVIAYILDDEVQNKNISVILKLRLYGATVLPELTEDVTHIVIPDENEQNIHPSSFPGLHVVTFKWVMESIKNGKLLNERIRF